MKPIYLILGIALALIAAWLICRFDLIFRRHDEPLKRKPDVFRIRLLLFL